MGNQFKVTLAEEMTWSLIISECIATMHQVTLSSTSQLISQFPLFGAHLKDLFAPKPSTKTSYVRRNKAPEFGAEKGAAIWCHIRQAKLTPIHSVPNFFIISRPCDVSYNWIMLIKHNWAYTQLIIRFGVVSSLTYWD